jgi:hypothetical protein
MTDSTAERLIEVNLRLIEAMGMHWENEQRKIDNNSMAYTEADFSNLANKHF